MNEILFKLKLDGVSSTRDWIESPLNGDWRGIHSPLGLDGILLKVE
jgi:hypothetical protein